MTEPSIRIVSQTQSLELTVRQIRDQLFDAVIDDVSVLEEKRSGAGVRLGEILRLTATDGFTTVTMKSTDGFTGTLPFEIAKDGILILELDGQPLPSKLGARFGSSQSHLPNAERRWPITART